MSNESEENKSEDRRQKPPSSTLLPARSPESIGRAVATKEILGKLQDAADAGPFMVSIWWEDKQRLHAFRRCNNFNTSEYARSIALLVVDLERSYEGKDLLSAVAKQVEKMRKQRERLKDE